MEPFTITSHEQMKSENGWKEEITKIITTIHAEVDHGHIKFKKNLSRPETYIHTYISEMR